MLVVDDEEWMRDACTQILEPQGFEVVTAADGQAGLQLAGQCSPDLVLLDLRMPGLDGMAYLKAVKGLDPEIVGIVITGYATLEVAVQAMKAGAYDFLPKPFKPEELRGVVRRGLEHRRAALRALARLHAEAPAEELHLAMLAHRFKAPLAVMRQCTTVVLEGYVGDISPRARGMIEIVAQRADQMMRFVNDWLTLSHLKDGEGLQKVVGVKIVPLVQEAVMRAKQSAEAERLQVDCEVIAEPGTLLADPSALGDLFDALLDNASRYTPPGGRVTVEISRARAEALVAVNDTGPGISPEDLTHIFKPFFRAKAQRDIPGTGLGLAIVKGIAEAHGGRIEVRTVMGRGSTFQVFLPLEAAVGVVQPAG
ncbi:MAG: response regulator [Candidatus Riflebacteria bacterium]|nr:response regulator [Candidatus Riflebacteria bacterium]